MGLVDILALKNNSAIKKNLPVLINEITLTQEASAITIDTDSNGNAFNLSKLIYSIEIPATSQANAETVAIKLRINGLTANYWYATATALLNYWTSVTARNLESIGLGIIDVLNGKARHIPVNFCSVGYASDGTALETSATNRVGGILNTTVTGITSLYFFSLTFPVGTTIRIEGIRI